MKKQKTYLYVFCGTDEFEKQLEVDGYFTDELHMAKISPNSKIGKILLKEHRTNRRIHKSNETNRKTRK